MFREICTALVTLAVVAGATLSAAQAQQSETDRIVGAWTVTVKGSGAHGDMTGALVIKQAESRLTGTLTAHGSEQVFTGTFVKGELAMTTGHADEAQRLTLKARLSDAGALSGYLSGPMGDMALTATRDKGAH